MKRKHRQKKRGFDELFDAGKVAVNFSHGVMTKGLSRTIKLPPLDVPGWLGLLIGRIAEFQANSRASVIRQLLVEAIEGRQRRLAA